MGLLQHVGLGDIQGLYSGVDGYTYMHLYVYFYIYVRIDYSIDGESNGKPH